MRTFFDQTDMGALWKRYDGALKNAIPETQEIATKANEAPKGHIWQETRKLAFAFVMTGKLDKAALSIITSSAKRKRVGSDGRWVSEGRLDILVGVKEARKKIDGNLLKTKTEDGEKKYLYSESYMDEHSEFEEKAQTHRKNNSNPDELDEVEYKLMEAFETNKGSSTELCDAPKDQDARPVGTIKHYVWFLRCERCLVAMCFARIRCSRRFQQTSATSNTKETFGSTRLLVFDTPSKRAQRATLRELMNHALTCFRHAQQTSATSNTKGSDEPRICLFVTRSANERN